MQESVPPGDRVDAPAPAAAGRGRRRRVTLAVGPGSITLAVYGALAVGLALAIGADTVSGTAAVAVAAAVELAVFYLVHVYSDTLGRRYAQPGTGWSEPLRYACRHDFALLLGGLPVLTVFVAGSAARQSLDGMATVALLALVVLLGGYGWLAARRGSASWQVALVQGIVTALLGLGVLVLKLLLK
jgi:hypothetical protein